MIADIDLDNIEAAAKGKTGVGVFAHPADTLQLVAEIRRLRVPAVPAKQHDQATMVDRGTDLVNEMQEREHRLSVARAIVPPEPTLGDELDGVRKAIEEAQQRKLAGTLPPINVADELDDIERFVRERLHHGEKVSASDALLLITEIRRLQKEWSELTGVVDYQRAAVAKHHAQHADDLCWLDDDILYAAFGLPPRDVGVGDKQEMLKNCERFIERRCMGGGSWKSYKELEEENAALRAEMDRRTYDVVAEIKNRILQDIDAACESVLPSD